MSRVTVWAVWVAVLSVSCGDDESVSGDDAGADAALPDDASADAHTDADADTDAAVIPVSDDRLCGARPGGQSYGTQFLRFESAHGHVVQLSRRYESVGSGESSIFALDAMALRIDGEEICIDAASALEYENTHHNWQDVARGTAGDTTYQLALTFEATVGALNWSIALSARDGAGAVLFEEPDLVPTGSPPFCSNGCPGTRYMGISELVVDNASLLVDEAGEHEPLIELYNPGSEAVDLTGWSLSNDFGDRRKWVFEGVTIGRHEVLVVFADGEPAEGPLHASFRLSAGGGAVILTAPDGFTDGGFIYEAQAPDHGLAFDWSVSGFVATSTPTPGEPPGE